MMVDDLNLRALACAVIAQALADARHRHQQSRDTARYFLASDAALRLWADLAGVSIDAIRAALDHPLRRVHRYPSSRRRCAA